MNIPIITIEDDYYIYYPDRNIFSKKLNRYLKFRKNKYGYLNFRDYNDKKFKYVHRLIYEKFVGKIPKGLQINHKNNIRDDNRLENLEVVNHQKNIQYQLLSKNNTSGYKGICWDKASNKWRALIQYNKKRIHLGYIIILKKLKKCITKKQKN